MKVEPERQRRGRGRSKLRLKFVIRRIVGGVWGQSVALIQLLCKRVFQVTGRLDRIHPLLSGTASVGFILNWDTWRMCSASETQWKLTVKVENLILGLRWFIFLRRLDNFCGTRWRNIKVGRETISTKHQHVVNTCDSVQAGKMKLRMKILNPLHYVSSFRLLPENLPLQVWQNLKC